MTDQGKVVHILGELRASGAEMMVLDSAPWFSRRGIETMIVSTGTTVGPMGEQFRSAGVDVVHLPFSGTLQYLRSLRAILHSGAVAHVHTERASFWVCLALRLQGTPVVRSIHSVFRFGGLLRLRRLGQRQMLRLAGVRFIAVDEQVSDNERTRFRLETHIIRNFSSCRFAEFQHPGLANPTSRIVSVGNCGHAKNHEAILQALSLLVSRGESWTYTHVGTEEQATVDERAMTHALSIQDRVEFIGHADPLVALARADVFVMPSRYEGLGIAALEAINVGIPVLLADSPGLRAFKQAPGVWWCSTDAHSVADQLQEIRRTAIEDLSDRAASASDWASTAFSRQRSLDQWYGLYRNMNHGRS